MYVLLTFQKDEYISHAEKLDFDSRYIGICLCFIPY